MYDLYKIIKTLCDKKGVSIAKMSKEAGVSKGIFTDLKAGRRKGLSHETLAKLSNYFQISTDYLMGLVDEYGLTPDDWSAMGLLFSIERANRGISLEEAVDGVTVTVEQLREFEENGTPLREVQLTLICGLIGSDSPSIFSAWADKLYSSSKPSTISNDKFDPNSFEFAAHKYSGDLTERDKDTIIKMMETLASANKRVKNNGQVG